MIDDDIDALLQRFDPPQAALGREVIDLVREIRPDFTPKVSFSWMTVNFHHPKAKFVIAVYLRPGMVLLVFQDGRLLDSPLLVDDGKVKKVRWIPFEPGEKLPVDDIAILISEAIALRS